MSVISDLLDSASCKKRACVLRLSALQGTHDGCLVSWAQSPYVTVLPCHSCPAAP